MSAHLYHTARFLALQSKPSFCCERRSAKYWDSSFPNATGVSAETQREDRTRWTRWMHEHIELRHATKKPNVIVSFPQYLQRCAATGRPDFSKRDFPQALHELWCCFSAFASPEVSGRLPWSNTPHDEQLQLVDTTQIRWSQTSKGLQISYINNIKQLLNHIFLLSMASNLIAMASNLLY